MEIRYYKNRREDNEVADFIYEIKDKKTRKNYIELADERIKKQEKYEEQKKI